MKCKSVCTFRLISSYHHGFFQENKENYGGAPSLNGLPKKRYRGQISTFLVWITAEPQRQNLRALP